MVVTTLGATADEQRVWIRLAAMLPNASCSITISRRFRLGKSSPCASPAGEIGHGALAEKIPAAHSAK